MIDWDPEFVFGRSDSDGDIDDSLDESEEEYIFDTYDRIVDENELSINKDDGFDLRPEDIGLAFAFAEAVMDEEKSRQYDVDENTDTENWEKVQKLVALETRHKTTNTRLRPFEQYVDEICKGKRSLFDFDND